MKIVFLSNYFNHHQKAFSDAVVSNSGIEYHFVETAQMSAERKQLGYGLQYKPPYVINLDEARAGGIIESADVIISGSAPIALTDSIIKSDKLLFRYAERPLKDGLEPLKFLPRLIKWHKQNPFNKRIYMLCASAFTSADYKKFVLFRDKMYKWAYFPDLRRYEQPWTLFDRKKKNHILWCGRLIDWKHPELALDVANKLKENGYSFMLSYVGIGDMEGELRALIDKYRLSDCVQMLGSMPPEQVREHMERAGIYLFTSDRKEGWGAVLNEAMNSGCAVVASHLIGSVPFLLKNGENGLIYKSGDADMLYEKVRYLLDHPDEQTRLGMSAYHTITDEWNAEVAAERFVELAQRVLAGDKSPEIYGSGPCSKADIIKESRVYK